MLTAIGAASPAACAIIGPIALGFAGRYKISPLMMGMFVVHGAQAGGFSPISIYGTITNSVMEENDLPVQRDHRSSSPAWWSTSMMAAILFVVLGGRKLMSPRASTPTSRRPDGRRTRVHRGGASTAPAARHRRPADRRRGSTPRRRRRARQASRDQVLTLVAFVGVALVALVFDKNIGFVAITAAVILADAGPQASTRTPSSRSPGRPSCWSPGSAPTRRSSTTAGAPEFVGNWAAGLGAAVIGALILCYVGGVVSAFASSTALLPVIIPIAIPLIADGGVSAGLFVAALAVSSTIVDVSPFSTNGALMLANRPDTIEEAVYYKQILTYSVIVVARRTAAGLGRPRAAGLVIAMTDRPDPLADVLVVDLSRALAGPHATMMLGDLGARVIKVEAPGTRRRHPRLGPAVRRPEPTTRRESTYFLSANRNKESITLDLKDEADRDVLLRLVDRADVLVENFRTGVLERLGLGIERAAGAQPAARRALDHRLRPRRPRGRPRRLRPDRPGRGRPDVADRLRARRPAAVGVPIADLLAGMYGAYGVARRAATSARAPGSGTVVRTSLLAAVVGVHAFQGTRWTVAGEVGRAQGNHHPRSRPTGCSTAADGSVQIAVGSEGLWRRFCAGFGLDPATPGLATNPRAGRATASGPSSSSRRPSPGGTAEPAARPPRRGRHPRGQGAHARRGLRVGPGRQPGAR